MLRWLEDVAFRRIIESLRVEEQTAWLSCGIKLYRRGRYKTSFPDDVQECRIRGVPAREDCPFLFDAGHPAATDAVWLSPGAYDVAVDVTALGKCERARDTVDIKFDWRLSPITSGWFDPAIGSEASMHFDISANVASMGRLEQLSPQNGLLRVGQPTNRFPVKPRLGSQLVVRLGHPQGSPD